MKYEELVKALREYSGCRKGEIARITSDAAAAIEALQAEVERLKECNDELREAQTYIDHYGDKWMTSAKDVPTSAYNHGYADGRDEAEQALEPKRGEIVRCVDCKWNMSCGYISTRSFKEWKDWFCADGEREVLE